MAHALSSCARTSSGIWRAAAKGLHPLSWMKNGNCISIRFYIWGCCNKPYILGAALWSLPSCGFAVDEDVEWPSFRDSVALQVRSLDKSDNTNVVPFGTCFAGVQLCQLFLNELESSTVNINVVFGIDVHVKSSTIFFRSLQKRAFCALSFAVADGMILSHGSESDLQTCWVGENGLLLLVSSGKNMLRFFRSRSIGFRLRCAHITAETENQHCDHI